MRRLRCCGIRVRGSWRWCCSAARRWRFSAGTLNEAIALARESLILFRELKDTFGIVYTLAPLAAATAINGDDLWAARILGARDAVTDRTGATVVDSGVRDLGESAERAVRARLTPERWGRAYAAGRTTSIDSLLNDIEHLAVDSRMARSHGASSIPRAPGISRDRPDSARGLMPINTAASCFRFDAPSARRTVSRSAHSRLSRSFKDGTAFLVVVGDGSIMTASRRITRPDVRTTARSTVFSSWRTLPWPIGLLQRRDRGLVELHRPPAARRVFVRKEFRNIGTSSSRSRSGGTRPGRRSGGSRGPPGNGLAATSSRGRGSSRR